MHTILAPLLLDPRTGTEAEAILRACVHCGLCNATCPTYQLLGDELDGPRGRIYLIKQVLEGTPATSKTQAHLDRCLGCRACETACPSGVRYARLVDIGRGVVEQQVGRAPVQNATRWLLGQALTRDWIFARAYRLGKAVRGSLPAVLPASVSAKLYMGKVPGTRPRRSRERTMVLLEGCVQPAMSPNINAAAARVLDRLGVQLLSPAKAGCCGAVRYHLNDHEGGLAQMRNNIDAWWPLIDQAEAIVITASGCGATVKDYGKLLAHDGLYADRAAAISAKARDLVQVMEEFAPRLKRLMGAPKAQRVAFHAPCSLQHALKLGGRVEALMGTIGLPVIRCAGSDMCCGSAGTYSVLQPTLSTTLRDQKLVNLQAGQPALIASANIGCIAHLQSGTETPVRHWIELVEEAMRASAAAARPKSS
jgi:glycolate oxidase iron-sulfur subunit